MKKFTATLLLLLLTLTLLTSCGGGSSKKGLVIGSKQFTENILMGEIYSQLISAKTDIPVTYKSNLGGTSVCLPALQEGEIDMYFEYTGTMYNEIADEELKAGDTPESILAECKKKMASDYGVTVFDPVGFNNTYAFALRADRQKELGVTTISELAPLSSELKFGAGHIFYTREHDGYNGVVATYGLHFKEALKMDSALLYESSASGDLDIINVFSTDGLLKKYDLVLLEDDQHVFPPYHGVLICRSDALAAYPELQEVLNSLAGKIDDKTMQELNYQVDVEKRAVEDVARDFLTAGGYLSA